MLGLEEKGSEITPGKLKNTYLGLDKTVKTLLEIFKDYNDKSEKLVNIDFSPETVKNHKACYRNIQQFIKAKYRKADLPLREATPMFINDFEFYMKTTQENAAIRRQLNILKH